MSRVLFLLVVPTSSSHAVPLHVLESNGVRNKHQMAGLLVFTKEDGRIKKHQRDGCLKDALDRESEHFGSKQRENRWPDGQEWKQSPLSCPLRITAVHNIPFVVMIMWCSDQYHLH